MTVTLEDVAQREISNCYTWQHAQGACGQCEFCQCAALVRAAAEVVEAARKARAARWVQPIDYDRRADYNADMAFGEALAQFDSISKGETT